MLRSLTKDDILQFYDRYVSHLSEHRRKLSCHVVSTSSTISSASADSIDSVVAADSKETNGPSSVSTDVRIVEDITEFKMSQPLFPLPKPFCSIHAFKRTVQHEY